MDTREAKLLFRPDEAELLFLPEGPMGIAADRISWVAIQHGSDSTVGSINTLDRQGNHARHDLPERPGFAFPVNDGQEFIVGVSGRVQHFHVASGELTPLSDEIEADEPATIINDGMIFDGGVIFGSKHLAFSEPVAGLYLWREGSTEVTTLRDGQTCSNGKDLRQVDGQALLLDIDTPTFQIVEYPVDLEQGVLGRGRLVVDLENESLYPDGMVITPDGKSLIVAIYNPNPRPDTPGEVRQYSLAGQNQLEIVWKLPAAPQVTCPQLVEWDGKVQLLITTAVEHMDDDKLAQHSNSGGLFLAETEFANVRPLFEPA